MPTTECLIGRAKLTTQHSASSYGLPVLVLDGTAYGPDDDLDGFPAGSVVITILSGELDTPPATLDLAERFLSQSPERGPAWVERINVYRHPNTDGMDIP